MAGLELRSGVTVRGSRSRLGNDSLSGTIVQALDRSVTPIFEAAGTEYAAISDLKILGNAPQDRNEIVAIHCADLATYLQIYMVSIRYCGGTAIHLRGGGNRVEFLRSRNRRDHIIQLDGHDSHVMFGDFGDTDRREKDGIVVTGHQKKILANNVFNCCTGIRLASGNRDRVLGNRCEKHGYYGGIVVNSYENNVVSNQCWNNSAEARRDQVPSAGIHVLNRSTNTVSGNMLFHRPTSDDPFQDIGILVQGAPGAPAS